MRNYLALLVLVFLTACGGSGSSVCSTCPTGSTVPYGSVSGKAFDGLILNGTVSVYDFSAGTKGALLGQAATDGSGLYSLSLQVESRPVLLEITGGYYNEEAGTVGTNTQVSLPPGQKLTALDNYMTGAALNTSVTTYTHLAAGLAAYEIRKGAAVSTAINDANNRVSSLAGVNILTTTPKEVTDVANASAYLTPELRYGFLAGAISMWTYNNAPSPSVAHLPPYTSIDFAQSLYQDISADGLLDGIGLDSSGNVTPLSFGTVPLDVNVYRQAIGAAIVQMAGDPNNKTGLTGAQVLPFAGSYVSSTDPMFNGVPPTTFAPASVVIFTPAPAAWARKTINVTSTASSPFGLKTVALLVDGISVANSPTLATQTFPIDTTAYADGAHTIVVSATDLGGFVTTATVQAKIANTPPTSTMGDPSLYPTQIIPLGIGGVVSGGYSGAAGTLVTTNYGVQTTVAANGSWVVPMPSNWNYWSPTAIYRVRDMAGNCSDYSASINAANSFVFLLVALGTCP